VSQGPLNIGICCYPTFGGSGVIATEVGLGMARRGHRVHLFAYDRPARLAEDAHGIHFHRVEVRDYPVFHQPPYTLALTSRLVDVARHEHLDILHVHYAVPHATSAFLARAVLGDGAPRIVTTLHGTDITLVGSDPTYKPITRFSIQQSDAVTVPSAWLRDETHRLLDLAGLPIEVIPNFVDVARFSPRRTQPLGDGPVQGQPLRGLREPARLVHVSNFRPVKRVPDVVLVFAAILRERPAHLTLIGDGPERGRVEALVDTLGLAPHVDFVGELHDVRAHLADADLFLLPSASESFGVAALEAQAMGVPVIASRVGGLPEVIEDGVTGRLLPVGDVTAMTTAALELLGDPARLLRMRDAARERAVGRFEMNAVLDRYEALYRRC